LVASKDESKETELDDKEVAEKYETEVTEKYETEQNEKAEFKILETKIGSPSMKSVKNSSSSAVLSIENKNCYSNVDVSLDDEFKVGDDASSFNNVGTSVDQNDKKSKRQQIGEKIVFVRQRLKDVFEKHLSVDHFVMPEEPNRWHQLKQGVNFTNT